MRYNNHRTSIWLHTTILLLVLGFFPLISSNKFDKDDKDQTSRHQRCDQRAKIEGKWSIDDPEHDVIMSTHRTWKADGKYSCLASLSDLYKRERLHAAPEAHHRIKEDYNRLSKQVTRVTFDDESTNDEGQQPSATSSQLDTYTDSDASANEDPVNKDERVDYSDGDAMVNKEPSLLVIYGRKGLRRRDTSTLAQRKRYSKRYLVPGINLVKLAAGSDTNNPNGNANNPSATSSKGSQGQGQVNALPPSAPLKPHDSSLGKRAGATAAGAAKQVPPSQPNAAPPSFTKVDVSQAPSAQPTVVQSAALASSTNGKSTSDQPTQTAQANIEKRSPAPATQGGGSNSTGGAANAGSAKPPSGNPPVALPSSGINLPVVIKPPQAAPSKAVASDAAKVSAVAQPPAQKSKDSIPTSPAVAQVSPNPSAAPHMSVNAVVTTAPALPVASAAPMAPTQPQVAPTAVQPAPAAPASGQVVPDAPEQSSNSNGNNGDGGMSGGSRGGQGHGFGNQQSPTTTRTQTRTISLPAMTTIATAQDQSSSPMSLAQGPIIGVVVFVVVALAAFGLYVFVRVSRRRGWKFGRNGYRSSKPLPRGFFKPAAEY